MSKKKQTVEVEILQLEKSHIRCCAMGTSPLILNAMSEKVKQGLILPPKKQQGKQRELSLKHDPVEEFRGSVYQIDDDASPTALGFPASGLKKAIASAAVDIPGATKASMMRLCWVPGELLPLYGVPELHMAVVRCADINRTPDMRTRAILRNWAIIFDLEFIRPNLNEKSVGNLVQAAGMIIGIGDFRQEKGRGNYGLFSLVDADNKELVEVQRNGDRKAQLKALEQPNAYDRESEALWQWFEAEAVSRDLKKAAA